MAVIDAAFAAVVLAEIRDGGGPMMAGWRLGWGWAYDGRAMPAN
jgi:hypothetical protein